jgi:predicted permease
MVSLVAGFAARFSVRALEVTVDASLLWIGAGLAIAAAILLAYVPKLPSSQAPSGFGLANGSLRITPGTNRRLRVFATAQIAFSFVLLAGAATLIATLMALQGVSTGYNMTQVLAIDLPSQSLGVGSDQEMAFYQEVTRRVEAIPGVAGVALGMFVPWRDNGRMGAGVKFTVDGFTPADGEENPHARFRVVGAGFFNVIGVPLLAGRDFNADDRRGSAPVVIVSQTFAQRMFPNGDALNHTMWWTDPYFGPKPYPRRIVGVVADVDDENIERSPALTVYQPMPQIGVAGRMFVHTSGDPHALIQPITTAIHGLSATQPVERPATLEEIRAEVLAPERLNAFVLSGFAGVALLIAVVGVAGVLAFGVSARTREFGVRLAIGSTPYDLLRSVLSEGVVIVSIGIISGAVFGYGFAAVAASYFGGMQMPGPTAVVGAAGLLVVAALVASLMPASRASRVDVLQALRSE